MFTLSIAILLSGITTGEANSWPAFLGSGATAVNAEQLPLLWKPAENIAWRADLPGHGQSSPVIWGERVFLTSVEGPNKETYQVVCLDLKTGQQRWTRSLKNSAPVANSVYVSRAAPTPTVDAQRVVAQFESGDCVAFDHDGQLLWQRDLSKDYGPFVAEFGLGASPCQTDTAVFVLLEHDGPSCLVALDKKSGETRWKADRKPRRSWSSPSVINIAGSPQIVVSSAGTVDGYDPVSGKLLWTFAAVGGNTGTTPIDIGDGKFLIAASAGRQDENVADPKKSNFLMQVVREGEDWKTTRVWSTEEASPSWASPIVHRGYAYWINRVGVVYCFDAITGMPIYTERTKQSCWATPFAVGDRIYLFGKDGLCSVIAAGPEFKVLAENQLWNPEDIKPEGSQPASESTPERQRAAAMFGRPTLYGYAVAQDRFVIRTGNQVFCVAQ